MRKFLLLAACGLALPLHAAGAQGMQRHRDQDAAIQAMQRGQILPLSVIRARITITGADFIGADFDERAGVYRLKFMRGRDVIWVDVDARTGRPLGRSSE
jgi:hypothetical protein